MCETVTSPIEMAETLETVIAERENYLRVHRLLEAAGMELVVTNDAGGGGSSVWAFPDRRGYCVELYWALPAGYVKDFQIRQITSYNKETGAWY